MKHRNTAVWALLGPTINLFIVGTASAEVLPEWTSKLPVGSSLTAGTQGLAVDAAGVSFVTGITGSSSNTDTLTAAYGTNGALLWSHTYNGPANWHDQARGITVHQNKVWVCGNTPDAQTYAKVLLLGYDAATGALLSSTIYSSGSFVSEYGGSVTTDTAGNVYVGGGTNGDGSDGMLLKFDSNGVFQWKQTYDGDAWGPFSQDSVIEVAIDGNGDVFALINGYAASLHPDYVVNKYSPLDGGLIWSASWGVNGGDFPRDLELDAANDVYVTGTAIDFIDKYSTIKLQGSDGALIWQAYDSAGQRNAASALALDGQGGVYVTGSTDPDGDMSNQNDNYFTVRRDATTGAQGWTHLYGANCVGCSDVPSDVAVDSAGSVYVMGRSSSAPYSADLLLFVLDAGSGGEIDRGAVPSGANELFEPGALRFDASENLYHAGNLYNANTGARAIATLRYTTQSQSIYQLYVTALESGVTALISPFHATPGATQFLIFTTSGPATIDVPSFGVTLGIGNPSLLLSGPASASGDMVIQVFVPPGITGLTAWFQCVEFGQATNVIQRTVQ